MDEKADVDGQPETTVSFMTDHSLVSNLQACCTVDCNQQDLQAD